MIEQHPIIKRYQLSAQDDNTNNLYVLLDGLQYHLYFLKKIVVQDSVYDSLFTTQRELRLAFAGPWLIRFSQLNEKDKLELLTLETELPALSWVISQQPFSTLKTKLQPYLNINLPDKQAAILRFYDPRVLAQMEQEWSSDAKTAFLDGITQWWYWYEDKHHLFGTEFEKSTD